jgi:hypothetical protein
MNKVVLVVAGVFIFILLVGAGAFAFMDNREKATDETTNETTKTTTKTEDDKIVNKAYADCLEEAKEAQASNEAIVKSLEEKAEACTRKAIQDAGYTDSLWCVGTEETDPACESTERYNAEVYGGNDCNENWEGQLEEAGYDSEAISVLECLKYVEAQ